MSGEIIAIAEQRDGALKKSALEMVTAAHGIAKELGAGVTAVIFSENPVDGAGQLGRYGASEVLSVSGAAFKSYAPMTFAHVIADLAKDREARAVVIPASVMGKDLAPRLSALLGVPQASDCIGFSVSGGSIEVMRPVYGGKAIVTVVSKANCLLATVRPNIITPVEAGAEDAPVTDHAPAQVVEAKVTLKDVVEPEGGKKLDVTEADTIVAGGRGMKGPENYGILEDLALALGGTVGSSRAAVDAGWRPHSEQVGQTGKTVSPNLYIACGVSGAIQHLAGMSSSRVIVAINKDPEAPIFKVADYGIVGDLMEVVPALTEEVKKLKASD